MSKELDQNLILDQNILVDTYFDFGFLAFFLTVAFDSSIGIFRFVGSLDVDGFAIGRSLKKQFKLLEARIF